MTVKITWFFEAFQQAPILGMSSAVGWTETWYHPSNDIEIALSEAAVVAPPGPIVQSGSYLYHRLRCLPEMYRVPWVRASVEPLPGFSSAPFASKVVGLAGVNGQLADGVAYKNNAQVQCALLVDFTVLPNPPDTRTHHRRWLIRGLPTAIIGGNVLEPFGEAWARMISFLNFLGRSRNPNLVRPGVDPRGPYMTRYLDPTQNLSAVNSLALVAPGNKKADLTFAPAIVLARGDRVRVSRVTFPRGMNRTWVVSDLPVAGGARLGSSSFQLAGEWDGSGVAKKVAYLYRKPDQYTIIGLRSKKTGRPFKQLRGRQRRA